MNRKAAEDTAIKWVSKIDKSGINTTLLKETFANLTDEEFGEWIEKLTNGEDFVPITIPNQSKCQITIDNNLKVAKEMNVDFFQHIEIKDPDTGIRYTTPIKYMVIHLPVKRLIETLKNKIGTQKHNKHIDALTGQPVGKDSKGAGISFPETLVLMSHGMEDTLTELLKVRGGDTVAYNEFLASIYDTGGASLDHVANLGTKTRSTQTLSTYLRAMHYENNL